MSGEGPVEPHHAASQGPSPGSVAVLGPVVCGQEGDGSLGGRQPRLLLSLLVCEAGRVVSTDRLLDAVWGDDAGEGNRRTLQVHISKLRSALGEVGSIEHRNGGYVLEAADGALDLSWFEELVEDGLALRDDDPDAAAERLRTALGLWRGQPFGELASEPALSAEVTRLQQLRMRAFEELAAIEVDRGRQDRVVPELRRLVAEHPLREPLWRLLMLALYRAGRQGEALEAYETARGRLADELGVDPSRELQELHTAILRQDASLDPPQVRSANDLGAGAPALGSTAMSASELIGRDHEVARLSDFLHDARSGRPRLLLLGGDAGLGKSRLLEQAGRLARDGGAEVLMGRCIDLGDAALPFAPIAQILRGLAGRLADDALEEALGPARHELARIAPALGEAPTGGLNGDPEVRGRLFSAVLAALGRMARQRPLLVAFEDVHWADRSTLDLLGFLAGNLDEQRLLLTATFRTDELHRRHPLRGVLGELTRLPQVVRIDLEPLSAEGVAAQVRGILGEEPGPALLDEVVSRSSGNPFYVEELVAAAREGGEGVGSGLHDVIAARLERLPEESRDLLDMAAVAGGSVDERLLAATTGEDPLELAGRLRPAVDRHVLVPEDSGYRFRHDLVREVVADDLLPGERVALHARIARALEDDPDLASGGTDHVDAEVAHHWYAAREDQRAFDASLRAADRARRAAALAEALAHDERVLELWDRVDHGVAGDRVAVLERAAETARLIGSFRRGIALVREALEEVEEVEEDRLREADLRRVLALALALSFRSSDRAAARAEVERALSLVAEQPPSERKARIVAAAARIHLIDDRHTSAVRLGRQAIAIAEEIDDRHTIANAHMTVGAALSILGGVDAGLAEVRDGLQVAKELGDVEGIARGYNNLLAGIVTVLVSDPDEEMAVLQEALSWLEEQGEHGFDHAVPRDNLAMASFRWGHWDLAEEVLADLSARQVEGKGRVCFHVVRAILRWARGSLDAARDDARTVHELGFDYWWFIDRAYCVEALVAVERGQLDEVRRILDERRQRPPAAGATESEVTIVTLLLLRALVRAEVDRALVSEDTTGRADAVQRVDRTVAEVRRLHEELHDEDAVVYPYTRHLAETNLRMAEAEQSRLQGSDPSCWRAVLDHAGPGYDRIYAGLRLGEALLATGDDSGAHALREAHREATRLGAQLLRERIATTAEDAQVRLDDS